MRRAMLLIATLMAGCRSEVTPGTDSYTIADSAGIQIVESLSPAWGDEGPRIDPESLVRIGQEEEGPYQFGFLFQALVLEDGTIVVPEVGAQEVRHFDPSGSHLRTFGGSGSGPGEFRGLVQVLDYLGDSIAAFDQRLYRTTVFSLTSGDSRAVENLVPGNYQLFGALQNGSFLLFNPGEYNPNLQQGLQWDYTDIVAQGRSGGSYEVIARLPVLERMIGPGAARELLIPFQGAIQAAGEDGFYWATSDRYEINFYNGEGSLRRIIRRPVQPNPVEPSMIEEYVEAQLERVRRFEGEAAVPRNRRRYEEAHLGEHVPLFGMAFVDNGGRLWVSGSVWPSSGEPPRQWSVFSKEGVWLGDLEAPDGVRIVDSRGDLVLGIWFDEMDVPYVQLHRLIGG
jgi:hypothetical protein